MFSLTVLIIRIIENMFEGLVISIFIKLLFNKELKALPVMCYSIIYALFSTLNVLLFFDIPSAVISTIIDISFFLILAISARIIYKLKIKQSSISIGAYAIFSQLSQACSVFILTELNFPLDNLTKTPTMFLIGCLLIIVLDVIFLFITKLLKSILVFPEEIRFKTYIFFIANIVVSSVIVVIITNLYTRIFRNVAFEKNIMGIVTFLFIIYFLISMSYMIYFSRQELKNKELEYQKFYNKTLEELMTDLRRQKHNYSNEMASISWFVRERDLDGLSRHMSELQENWNKIDTQSIPALFNIKNAAITGLLLSKIQKARELDVQVRVNILDEVNIVNMKISRLCEALGILLDNAIEASADSTEKILKIDIANINGGLSFCIENSIPGKPELSKMFLKGWSTKGDDRGLGLWILNNIKRQNKNTMLNTYVDDNRVKQEFIVC